VIHRKRQSTILKIERSQNLAKHDVTPHKRRQLEGCPLLLVAKTDLIHRDDSFNLPFKAGWDEAIKYRHSSD